jgi:hypothetical protein
MDRTQSAEYAIQNLLSVDVSRLVQFFAPSHFFWDSETANHLYLFDNNHSPRADVGEAPGYWTCNGEQGLSNF